MEGRSFSNSSYTVLDGSGVTLEGAVDLSVPPVVAAVWSVNGRARQFVAGPRENAESFARSLGVVVFDEEFGFGEGSLLLGSDVLFDAITGITAERRWAVWRGTSWSLYTHIVGDRESSPGLSNALIARLNQFDIEELSAGMRLSARDSQATPMLGQSRQPTVWKQVPGIGTLDIYELTDWHRDRLPSWRGEPVHGGDLYSVGDSELDDGTHQSLLALVGGSAYTLIAADPDVDEVSLLDAVATLSVAWIRPG